jgi:S-adenosylmethionine synthetase
MQHAPNIVRLTLEDYFVNKILPVVKERHKDIEHLFTDDYKLLINPTGRFVIGGPQGDTGLTGRKIIVDTYGGRCPHGGGAFSGKDCTKVDRSAAYGARHIAKLLVKSGAADEVTVQLSYAIGVPSPLSILVKGKLNYPVEKIESAIREFCPLTPYQLITTFGLKDFRYGFRDTAVYGHFRNEDFPWENVLPEEVEVFKGLLK